jgi:hypothetical protein
MMIVIAVAALVMGMFRFVAWTFTVFGSELLFDFAFVIALIPTVVFVEFLFLALSRLFSRSQVRTVTSRAMPNPRLNGEADKA